MASPAGFCLPLAQTHQKLGGEAIYFFERKASKFLETYLRKHSSGSKLTSMKATNFHGSNLKVVLLPWKLMEVVLLPWKLVEAIPSTSADFHVCPIAYLLPLTSIDFY